MKPPDFLLNQAAVELAAAGSAAPGTSYLYLMCVCVKTMLACKMFQTLHATGPFGGRNQSVGLYIMSASACKHVSQPLDDLFLLPPHPLEWGANCDQQAKNIRWTD